jgi:transketolase
LKNFCNIFLLQHLKGLLKNSGPLALHPQKPLVDDAPIVNIKNVKLASPPNYKIGEQVATRLAYGTALAKVRTFFIFVTFVS